MVIWLLYLVICVYSFLDAYQTNLLFNVGATEANFLLVSFMEHPKDINTIIFIKSIVLTFLGSMLYLYQRKVNK